MVEWSNHKYGSGATASLGYGLELIVLWSERRLPEGEPKFDVVVLGRQLKERSHTLEEAKERAERVAKKWLADVQSKL